MNKRKLRCYFLRMFDSKTDVFIADLENQLRKLELDLIVANEKMAIYDDKIKDKTDIIEALKTTNNLLKSENKEKFDAQVVAIRKLQVELNQKSVGQRKYELSQNAIIESLQRNNDDLEKELKSYQHKKEDSKKRIATLEAQIKEKDDQISLLELGQNLDTFKIKEKDYLLKDQAAVIKKLRIQISSKKK